MDFSDIESLRAFGPTSQSGMNACNGPHNCSRICVGAPDSSYSCLCPNGMDLGVYGECVQKKDVSDSTTSMATCGPFKFRCNTGKCIEFAFTCSG